MANYKILESALAKPKILKLFILLIFVSGCYLWQFQTLGIVDLPVKEYYEENARAVHEVHEVHESKIITKTWITMGLCWSANAQVHAKEKFPYKESVPLSSQLWLNKTSAQVIVQIVYSEPDISQELKDYKTKLESYGVLVFLVPTGARYLPTLCKQFQY